MDIGKVVSPTVSEAPAREPHVAASPGAAALTPAVEQKRAEASAAHAADAASEPARAPMVAPPPAATSLRFHVDEDTGKTIVSVVDPASGEVLRQIPNDEALAIAKALGREHGALVDLKV
jgi:flagellar protein FlaG